jgi:hypothetical protein
MHKSKRKWLCVDCSRNTQHEHYFVHNEVWASAGMPECGMLCVGCLEDRLGRQLTSRDFTSAHINNPKTNTMTDLLRSRILS